MDFVLIHGHGQGGSAWQPVVELLTRQGHRAFAPTLPADRPEWLGADYARFVKEHTDAERPVLVGHSGGGNMLPAISNALDARHLVWFAAIVPDFDTGESFMTQVEKHSAEIYTEECLNRTEPLTGTDPISAYFLFHDCDLAQLRFALTTTREYQPLGVINERPVKQDLPPSTYVLPKDDRIARPDFMRMMARERLGVEPIEIAGGHIAHIAHADDIVDIVLKVAN